MEKAYLVRIYIFDTLSRFINPKQVGLYRNDGPIYIANSNGPQSSRRQKKIIRAFQFLGFKIEISSNSMIVKFFDWRKPENHSNKSYKTFHKENQIPIYINVNSNHPNSIIKFLTS